MAYKNYKSKKVNKNKKRYSSNERKAYWMGVGAGEIMRENSHYKGFDVPEWKIKDLGLKALASYEKGVKKKYDSFR